MKLTGSLRPKTYAKNFVKSTSVFFFADTSTHTYKRKIRVYLLAYPIRLCGRLYKTLLVTYERSVCCVNAFNVGATLVQGSSDIRHTFFDRVLMLDK